MFYLRVLFMESNFEIQVALVVVAIIAVVFAAGILVGNFAIPGDP